MNEKAQTLATEVLKTVKRCRDDDMTEDEKYRELKKIETLARDVTADTGQYNPNDDDKGFG